MSKYIEQLRSARTNKEVGHAVEKIMIDKKLSYAKLANIIGCKNRGTIPYKVKNGSFFYGEIAKILDWAN